MDFDSLINEVEPKTLKKQRDTILNVIMCPDKHKLSDAQVKNIEPIIDIIDGILNIREDMRKEYESKKVEKKRTLIGDRKLDYEKVSDLTFRKKEEGYAMIYNLDKFEGHVQIETIGGKEHVTLNGSPICLEFLKARKK